MDARTAAERLRIALQDSPITVYQQDRDLRYTWINDALGDFPPDRILGKTDAALTDPQDAAHLTSIKRHVLTTGRPLRSKVRATLAGAVRHFDLAIEPLRDESGTVVGITRSAVDVTPRRPAEEELRRRASLLDHAYDAIFVWDWDGSITDWNRGAERLCGYAEQEAVGRISHRLLRTRRPEAVEQFLRDLERDGLWEGELERTRRDGKTIYVNTRHILVREQNHRYVLEANRDVTSRKHAEARAPL